MNPWNNRCWRFSRHSIAKQNTGQATVVIENVNASQTTEPVIDDDFFGATDDLPRALQETDFRDEVLLVCDRCLFEVSTWSF